MFIQKQRPPDQKEKKGKKGLSPATKRLLKRMKNAKPLGLPDDPRELSHSVLAEERMEEKFVKGNDIKLLN